MFDTWISTLPVWVQVIAIAVALPQAFLIGYRIGRARKRKKQLKKSALSASSAVNNH
jgi:hypothetical protein